MSNIQESVRQLSNQLSTLHGHHKQQVYKCWELDFIEIFEGVEFCDLLYKRDLGLLDDDERVLLQQAINRCTEWNSEGLDFNLTPIVNGTANETSSIKFVVAKAIAGEAIGVISLDETVSDKVFPATIGNVSTKVFIVGTSLRFEMFYRFFIEFEQLSKEGFANWAALAFPRLQFALDLHSQLRKFKQDYEIIRGKIVHHLAAINDLFLDLLIKGMEPAEICKVVSSELGVDISPESKSTHGCNWKMKERQVRFDDKSVICEFHSKLAPKFDRIHFSAAIRKDANNKEFLLIGPFAEHLTV